MSRAAITNEIKRIDTIERVKNSVNGNPRYQFTFTDGVVARSMPDADFSYTVGNRGMRDGDLVVVGFMPSGRIAKMAPATDVFRRTSA